jgi:hypothetical protein
MYNDGNFILFTSFSLSISKVNCINY